MALNKAELFDDKQKRIAELSKALAHPARIAILQLLAERANCICGDITDELPLAQSTISQHLKALKKSGIIKGEVDGVRTCYCLNEEVVEEFNDIITAFAQDLVISTTQNCC
ncbi:ArsR/SmtB family transcription factor [Fodinibius halophilus]|uniref:Winged helix-turn-helix transcriptional regulator n=1 Tax=Fodinibius halophilus TaxID=1736908 RepID=A0A6M1SY64_9BACT|nr:metalloregulator ArsR/SmtB family transcription factor [Fodinibius halophilus]NGP88838.1 winged helix-turn-helix transcriptional regulator [Fodinibius halophilus]